MFGDFFCNLQFRVAIFKKIVLHRFKKLLFKTAKIAKNSRGRFWNFLLHMFAKSKLLNPGIFCYDF
jgi:hypothetical protein